MAFHLNPKQLSPAQRICISVCLVHLAIPCLFAFRSFVIAPALTKPRAIRVQTVHLAPAPPPAPATVVVTAPPKKPPPKKLAAKEPPKPKKKAAPKKKPQPQVSQKQQKQQALRRQIQQELAKVQQSRAPEKAVKPATKAPSPQLAPVVDRQYKESVASHLQSLLCLPDFGAVEVSIEISPAGKLLHWEILGSHSEQNQRYIADTLPHLHFPRFNGQRDESRTLRISLSNRL